MSVGFGDLAQEFMVKGLDVDIRIKFDSQPHRREIIVKVPFEHRWLVSQCGWALGWIVYPIFFFFSHFELSTLEAVKVPSDSESS